MRFLAVNTAGKSIEVVVFDNGKLFMSHDGEFRRASVVLLSLIEKTLNTAQLTLEDMDFLGVCIGAGSFTGIRIGVVTIRSLADALNKSVVGVTYSECLAYTDLSEAFGGFERIVTISDASNDYLYVAAFDRDRNEVSAVKGILTEELKGYLDGFKGQKLALVCEKGTEGHVLNSAIYQADGTALCKAIAQRFDNNGAVDYCKIEPIYVRVLQAERDLKLKEQRLKDDNGNG